jgi:rod shape-determining protein MreD
MLLVGVTLVVALVLMAAPRPFGPVPTPLFPVMVVYFWTVVRPDLMSAGIVFLSGLALDLLTGTPFGFWALGLLAASGAARMIRPYVLGAAMWRRLAGIAGTVAAASLAGLIALGAAGRPLQPGWLQLVQLILSVLTYPLLEAAIFALARGVGAGRGRT